MKRISRNYKATRLDQFIYHVYSLDTCLDILCLYDPDYSSFRYTNDEIILREDYIYCRREYRLDHTGELYVEVNLRSGLVPNNWEALRRFFGSSFSDSYGDNGRELVKELFPINLPLDRSIIIEKIILDEELMVILSIRDCRYNLTVRYDSETQLYITLCEELEDRHQYIIYQEFCNKDQTKGVERDLSRIIIDGDEVSE